MWHIQKNCSLFITSGTLSQLTGNTSICNTSKIDFRRLEALFCGVCPSPDFSLLSSRISLQNREKCRFEPTFKKARPARLSERKSLISSGFRRVRDLQKRPQNGHPCHSCIKDSKSGSRASGSWVRIPPYPPRSRQQSVFRLLAFLFAQMKPPANISRAQTPHHRPPLRLYTVGDRPPLRLYSEGDETACTRNVCESYASTA